MALLEINDKVYKIPKEVMKSFEDMSDYIKELEEENKKLNELVQFNVKTTITLTKRINKAIEYIEELYKMVKEQDSDNVNLIDRLEIILKILKGEENE